MQAETNSAHSAWEGDLRGYVLCTVARSGSNWMCQLLTSTGVLGKPLEYFNGEGRRLLTDPTYPDGAAEQVERVLTSGATPNGVYGVKVFPWQLDVVRAQVRWADAFSNVRFVHLARRDLVGQAISQHRAKQTNQWRSTMFAQGEPAYDGPSILACLHGIAREEARWASYFARNRIEPLRLVYEDAMANPQRAVDAVGGLVRVNVPRPIGDAGVDLAIQRDALTDEWRARFHADHGDASIIDMI